MYSYPPTEFPCGPQAWPVLLCFEGKYFSTGYKWWCYLAWGEVTSMTLKALWAQHSCQPRTYNHNLTPSHQPIFHSKQPKTTWGKRCYFKNLSRDQWKKEAASLTIQSSLAGNTNCIRYNTKQNLSNTFIHTYIHYMSILSSHAN